MRRLILGQLARRLIAARVEELMRQQDLIHIDVQERRLDALTAIEVNERGIPHLHEVAASLVEHLRKARVLVLDVALDQERVRQEQVRDDGEHDWSLGSMAAVARRTIPTR